MKIKDYLLPLPGTVLGMSLAAADYNVSWKTACCAALVPILMQMLVNAKKNSLLFFVFLVASVMGILGAVYFSYNTIFVLETFLILMIAYMGYNHRNGSHLYTFLFYGVAAVCGSYFLGSHSFGTWLLLLPALSVGAMTASVSTRKTPMRLLLVAAGWAAMIAYACLRMFDPWHFLFVLSLPLFFTKRSELATFVFTLLAGGGFLVYLI